MHGPWPHPCLANCSHHAKDCVWVHLCRPRATEDEVARFLLLEWWCDSLSFKSVPGQARTTWNQVGLLLLCSTVTCVLPSRCNHQRSCSRTHGFGTILCQKIVTGATPPRNGPVRADSGHVTTERLSTECARRVASSCSSLANSNMMLWSPPSSSKPSLPSCTPPAMSGLCLLMRTHTFFPAVGVCSSFHRCLRMFSSRAFIEPVRDVVHFTESSSSARWRMGALLHGVEESVVVHVVPVHALYVVHCSSRESSTPPTRQPCRRPVSG